MTSVRSSTLMKGYVGWVLLAACLVVVYQGWQTTQRLSQTEGRARAVVCDLGEDCQLAVEQPVAIEADFMHRMYQFKTSVGPVTVTCTRAYVVFGRFACVPNIGSIGTRR